jgi:hypothetical protein
LKSFILFLELPGLLELIALTSKLTQPLVDFIFMGFAKFLS